ncbi:DUF3987 domain-containing protein, partial [Shigella sp. SIG2]
QNPHMGTFEDIIVRKREQVVRIAALLELEKDPDSTVITLESTNSAIYLIEFYFKHLIYKLESLREISPAEKLDKWLQKRIITTAGYIFQKSYILQYAPYALRKKCVLDEALDILAEQRKIRIDDNLVVYIGNTITPSELAKKLNIPAFDAGVFICDHQNILKYHRNRL